MVRRTLTLLLSLALVLGTIAAAPPAAAAEPSHADGTLLAFGDARYRGSTDWLALSQPVIGIAATRAGDGYWLLARDGGIFSFGAAAFHGSTGDLRLNQPVVAMAATPTGRGYWLVAADGGVFTFGDAAFHGSAAPHRLPHPAVGIAPTPDGEGYWIAAGDGATYAFGNAPYLGNAPGHERITAIAATGTGQGYWLAGSAGGIFTFGDATFHGSAAGRIPSHRMAVGLAASPTGSGYWVVAGEPPVLAPGASGGAVAHLQARLDALGYWVPVDGRFGPVTTQALYALQKAAGIPRTGVFDHATQRALDARVVPRPRSTSGYVFEVDKSRQLLMIVSNGRLVKTFNTSTGNGARYRSGGGWAVAHTPEGWFRVYNQINGLRISELGELWRPKYFTGGYAFHGSPSIPPHPASHGCVRLSNAAINWIWDTNAAPIGTPVFVYS